jgi:hypothetical protein
MRNLGILWILYGLLRFVVGLGVFLYSGTLTIMWGALLTRVPNPWAPRHCPRCVYPCCPGSCKSEKCLGGLVRVHMDYTIRHTLAIRKRTWHAI